MEPINLTFRALVWNLIVLIFNTDMIQNILKIAEEFKYALIITFHSWFLDQDPLYQQMTIQTCSESTYSCPFYHMCWFGFLLSRLVIIHPLQCTQWLTTTHCVTTEKVPAKYRSLKMAEASLGKWSIFNDCGGVASTRHWISVHRGTKSAWKRFRILVQSREALERLYEALAGPV